MLNGFKLILIPWSPEGSSSRTQIAEYVDQVKECKETIASLQHEKAILGLSAAQVCLLFFRLLIVCCTYCFSKFIAFLKTRKLEKRCCEQRWTTLHSDFVHIRSPTDSYWIFVCQSGQLWPWSKSVLPFHKHFLVWKPSTTWSDLEILCFSLL